MGQSLIHGIGDEVLICWGAFLTVLAGAITVSRYFPSQFDMSEYTVVGQGEGRTYNSETCPICIEPHRLAVETNCGHKFCGPCIQSYISNLRGVHLFTSGILACPMCRQNINLLLISFARDEGADQPERREVERVVYEYNVRYGSGPRSWITYIRDCPVLFRHMMNDFFTMNGLVTIFRVRIFCCIAVLCVYLFSPVDIIPEAIFGFFGLLDDILMVFLCAIYLSVMYRRLLLSHQRNENSLLLDD